MSLRIVAILTALTGVAYAEDPVDKSEAQHLFDEGRDLLAAGKTADACAKFELSIAKDPRAVGTLLNLGLCNERRGKPATALALFQEAYDRASEANLPQHRDAAQEHIALLAPQVPTLAITVAGALPDETVIVDDKAVKLAATGTALLSLDPGPHRIVASARGRLPFDRTVTLAVQQRVALAIPQLDLPQTRTVIERANTRRLYGKIATFSGGGLVVAAGALAAYAYTSYHREFDNLDCRTIGGARLCNAHGHDVTTRARSLATGATVIGAVGAAALAAGLTLWLTAPDEHARLVPTADTTGAGLSLVGRF